MVQTSVLACHPATGARSGHEGRKHTSPPVLVPIPKAARWVMVARPQAELNAPARRRAPRPGGPTAPDLHRTSPPGDPDRHGSPCQDSGVVDRLGPGGRRAPSTGPRGGRASPPFRERDHRPWRGTTDLTPTRGSRSTTCPPRASGVEFRVVGEHTDTAQSRDGFVNVVIEGGPSSRRRCWPAGADPAGWCRVCRRIWPIFRRAS